MNDNATTNPISTVGVIGAGVMGRGIAEANMTRGISVVLTDTDARSLEQAAAELNQRGAAMPAGALQLASTCKAFEKCDLVIEAVTEKVQVKHRVLAAVEACLPATSFLASNTSSILISQLAQPLARPESFCGMHFCHPVRRRPLVEIVRGARTSDETLERAAAYARALGKSPIVVRDCPGFLVNRLLSPYLNESLELILEGAEVEHVEAAARAFGMPIGPLRQFDEYGIDVAVRSGAMLAAAYPDRAIAPELPVALLSLGRTGRKSGAGFFKYADAPARRLHDGFDEQKSRPLDAEVLRLFGERRSARRKFSPGEITMRLFLPMLLEATRALEEQIVDGPAAVDRALADGLGFLPLEGGLLRWADAVGIKRIVEALKPFEPLGMRYASTPLLQELAAKSRGFYDAFAATSSAARAA